MTTITAQDLRDSVGMPPVYKIILPDMWLTLRRPEPSIEVSLTDPQTAFGVALKLDEYEADTDGSMPYEWDVASWAEAVATCTLSVVVGAMAVRIRRIAQATRAEREVCGE